MQTKKVISRTLFPKMRSDAGEESRGCCEEDSYQFLLCDKRHQLDLKQRKFTFGAEMNSVSIRT